MLIFICMLHHLGKHNMTNDCLTTEVLCLKRHTDLFKTAITKEMCGKSSRGFQGNLLKH